jgi:Tfp pilus assembly protein PilO
MTARDRLIIVVVLVVAALGGVWFVGLSPKRKDAAELQTQIEVAQKQLADAEQKAATASKAKASYNEDYAQIATLGKAVPKSDALPSLLYQLQNAAHGARIDFRSLKLSATGGQGPTPAARATAAANTSNASAGSGSSSSGSTGGASSSSSSPSTPSTTPSAPATQAAAATLPPGASVGSAGFPTMPFSFVFNGSFFDMESFFRDVQRFVRVNGQAVDVRGRLLSVDAWSLSAGPTGFPNVKANISATAYLQAGDDSTSASTTPATTGTAASGSTAGPAPTADVAGSSR